MSVTSEVPTVVAPSRRRGGGGAVIPFPRSVPVDRPARAAGTVAEPGVAAARRQARRGAPRSRPVGRSMLPAPARRPRPRAHLVAAETCASVVRLDEHRSGRAGDELLLRIRPARLPDGLDAVPDEDRPAARPSAPGRARLTRRGWLVVGALASVAVAALLAVVAPVLGGRAPASSAVPSPPAAAVVVEPGDTLWSIARRVAPDRDARLVVADLRMLNSLPSADITVGQRLRLRSP